MWLHQVDEQKLAGGCSLFSRAFRRYRLSKLGHAQETDGGELSPGITPASSRDADGWVQDVAEEVSQQHEAQGGDAQRSGGNQREPRSNLQELTPVTQHAAPGRVRRRDAQAQEAQRSFSHQCRGNEPGGVGQHRPQAVREEVPEQDSRRACSDGVRRHDVG